MAQSRIYVVMQKDKPHRLVEAATAAQAIRHCVRPEFQARVATPKDVAALLAPGTGIERAETEQTPTTGTDKQGEN